MPKDEEYSPSGAPIYRHQAQQQQPDLVLNDEATIKQIEAHIAKYLGEPKTVFHELISEIIHVDVHVIEPTPQRNFYSLVTSGMSAIKMATPPGAEECSYAELFICLPPDWPLSEAELSKPEHYWPIRWLKMLARLPHQYQSWLGMGHTIPNGDPAEPFAQNTKLCCAMLVSTSRFGEQFTQLKINNNKLINFYALIPLYKEEMDYKLNYGFDELIERMSQADVSEVLNIKRQNSCK